MPSPPRPDPGFVHIHYLRPPDRTQVFVQELLHEDEAVSITFAREVHLPSPVKIEGEVVLEDGSDAVWFTFPETWHDIGRFHSKDGKFTGIYANILIPCTFEPGGIWRTTDLFLDLWIPSDGSEESAESPRGNRGSGSDNLRRERGDAIAEDRDHGLDHHGETEGGAKRILLLDEEELREAEERGWVSTEMATRARAEAHRLMAAFERGEWPPPIVDKWTRARCAMRAKSLP